MKIVWKNKPPTLTPDELRKKFGLGDVVSTVATPIARAVGLPCVDPKTGELLPESPCGKNKDWLNNVVPDILNPLNRG